VPLQDFAQERDLAQKLARLHKRDKTFRIGKPMRKVSWTKRFAGEDRHLGQSGYEDEERCGDGNGCSGVASKKLLPPARSMKKAASSFISERGRTESLAALIVTLLS
jgi:hypothetical protein